MNKNLPTHLIRNCGLKSSCRQTWDSLQELPDRNKDLLRYCNDCHEMVYLVDAEILLLHHIENNDCVAIPFEQTLRSHALKNLKDHTRGTGKIPSKTKKSK